MRYISEVIGDKYKNWKPGNLILIKAPTGSGKTSFVFDKLLRHAIEKGARILYFVNRKALKEQLDNRIKKLGPGMSYYIQIETYQSLENAVKKYKDSIQKVEPLSDNQRDPRLMSDYIGYRYIIADECHYFSADSLFNQNTELSYNWIMNSINGVRIFMSATMQFVEDRIMEDSDHNTCARTNMCDIHYGKILNKRYPYPRWLQSPILSPAEQQPCYSPVLWFDPKVVPIGEDDIKPDYSYVECGIISEREDIVPAIMEKREQKWLVFINDKKLCRDICDELRGKGLDAVFIDSDYSNRDDAKSEVEQIKKNEQFLAQVILSTSVMDNGVTLHDHRLVNIVLESSMNDSFFQMLGRKRNDGEQVKVYLLLNDIKTLKYREKQLQDMYDIVYDLHERFLEMKKSIHEQYQMEMVDNGEYKLIHTNTGNEIVNIERIVERANTYEFTVLKNIHDQIIELSDNTKIWKSMKEVIYTVAGLYIINSFSVARVYEELNWYGRIINENHKNGYTDKDIVSVMEKMRYLGMKDDDIDVIVHGHQANKEDKHIEKVRIALDKIVEICKNTENGIRVPSAKIDNQAHKSAYYKAVGDDIYNALTGLYRFKESIGPNTNNNEMNGIRTDLNTVRDKTTLSENLIDRLQIYGLYYKQRVKRGEGCSWYKLERNNPPEG